MGAIRSGRTGRKGGTLAKVEFTKKTGERVRFDSNPNRKGPKKRSASALYVKRHIGKYIDAGLTAPQALKRAMADYNRDEQARALKACKPGKKTGRKTRSKKTGKTACQSAWIRFMRKHLKAYMARGMTSKAAMRAVAARWKSRGV